MSATPHANGGLLTRDLDLPDFRDYAVDVPDPATVRLETTRKLGELMRDIYRDNPDRFRLFCPDETNSNRLGAVFEVSDRAFAETRLPPTTCRISRDGRVMEVLSEHNCHGWLEGYTLTGRHGMFATYEAFAMVSASQTIQHSKWLQEADHLPWRAKVPSLNVLLTSTAWRNDHNGFSHQGPGLIQNVITQRGNIGRVYLPPDANCLLSVADHCFRSRSYVNLIVIDKQPQLQWLTIDEAVEHCTRGAGVWDLGRHRRRQRRPRHRAGLRRRRRDDGDRRGRGDPARAAAALAHPGGQRRRPDDAAAAEGPPARHGRDATSTSCSPTTSTWCSRSTATPAPSTSSCTAGPDADRFRVRGFIEEGTTTTPFDMVVRNRVSRYHLVMDAINNARRTPPGPASSRRGARTSSTAHAGLRRRAPGGHARGPRLGPEHACWPAG